MIRDGGDAKKPFGTKGRSATLRAAALVLVLGLGGCDDRWSRLAPPRLVQLTCKAEGREPPMVLQIDTGLRRATWVNGPRAAEGAALVSPREYRLRFDGAGPASTWQAVINRFDGVMKREVGERGDQRQTWRCATEKAGTRL
jgi:hypothetical protein